MLEIYTALLDKTPRMTALCFIVPSKGRLHHLRQSLPALAAELAQHPDVRAVVVDANCPEGSAAWVQAHLAPRQPQQWQVASDATAGHFNLSRARNAGARAAAAMGARALCFLDADVLLRPGAVALIRAALASHRVALSASMDNELAGFLGCAQEAFQAVGGYDEAIEGWGGEDADLRWRLARTAGEAGLVEAAALHPMVHPHADRTLHHALADPMLSLRINSLYLQVKRDLITLLNLPELPIEHRLGIHAQVRQTVLAAASGPQGAAHLDLQLPPRADVKPPPGWQLGRRWIYSIGPDAPPP
jgi:glycosyltransferase involved in cell wall biosynthesis